MLAMLHSTFSLVINARMKYGEIFHFQTVKCNKCSSLPHFSSAKELLLYLAAFRVMIVAKKFMEPGRRRMHFAVSDADGLSTELKDLGVSYVNDTPVVMARDLSERRYVMQQPLTCVITAYITVLLLSA